MMSSSTTVVPSACNARAKPSSPSNTLGMPPLAAPE
jgi:hypothetical protein